jgi:hypothetical protein
MSRQHRTISPPIRFLWLYWVTAVIFGLMSLTYYWLAQLAETSAESDKGLAVKFVLFAVLCALAVWRLGVRIAVNDESLLIAKNAFSTEVIRWEWVAGFRWRHNLRGLGRPSERLWVTLDDGQEVATPVVNGRLSLTDRDIAVSDAQADALLAELERILSRSRQVEQS